MNRLPNGDHACGAPGSDVRFACEEQAIYSECLKAAIKEHWHGRSDAHSLQRIREIADWIAPDRDSHSHQETASEMLDDVIFWKKVAKAAPMDCAECGNPCDLANCMTNADAQTWLDDGICHACYSKPSDATVYAKENP